MKFQHKKLTSILALAGMLTACGGGNDASTTASSKLSQYAGRVTDENGAPAAGISIRLENRITDQVTEAITEADGSFSTEVDAGVYDIIFDDKDAVQYVSLQKTAVDLQEDKKDEVLLKTAVNLSDNLFTGTATYVNGTPAAQRKLLIWPSIARSTADIGGAKVPSPFMAQTDEQGNFSQFLGMIGMSFDFDVFIIAPGAPELDLRKLAADYQFTSEDEKTAFHKTLKNYLSTFVQESVDIEKPNGAMHIELTIESDTHNLRGATGAPSMVPTDSYRLTAFKKTTNDTENLSWQSALPTIRNFAESRFLEIIPSAHATYIAQKFTFKKSANNPTKSGEFTNGLLGLSKVNSYESLFEISDIKNSDYSSHDFFKKTALSLENLPWLYPFFTHIINLNSSRSGTFLFTDESNDTYSLWISTTYSFAPTSAEAKNDYSDYANHVLRYRSKKPKIKKIEFTLDNPI